MSNSKLSKAFTQPKAFSNDAAGREQAYQQAVKQGEKSITFEIKQQPKKK